MSQALPEPNRPGYKYDPKIDYLSTRGNAPKYTIAHKNLRSHSLSKLIQTPATLGPNAYDPNYRVTSDVKSDPVVQFPKSKRFYNSSLHAPKNET